MFRIVGSVTLLLAFALAYALSVVVGRATRLGGGEVALVWPAAAVAVIWLLTVRCDRLRWPALHLATFGVVTFVTNLATGAPPLLAAWFVVVNGVLAGVTVRLMAGGRRAVALRDPADLARLVAAVSIGTCCAAALATAYLAMTSQVRIGETFALFAVRNGASALLGVAIWLRLRDVTWARPRFSTAAVIEALVVSAGVGLVFFWIFWVNSGMPLAFLSLVPTMWLALRYSTTTSTLFLTAAGVWIIFATLSDKGVYVGPDVQARALLAQAMVCSLAVVVLALALYRDSRARFIAELKVARDQADQNSELLGAVLDSIHDGVVVVGSAGEVVLQNVRAGASGLTAAVVESVPSLPVSEGDPTDRRCDVSVVARDSRVVELTTAPLARQPRLSVMAFRDVTDERRNAQALRETRDLFAAVLQAASEQAIIGTDPCGRITVFNNGAERMLAWPRADMLGRTPMEFHYLPEVVQRARELDIPVGFDVFIHNVTPDRAEVREWTYIRRDGSRVQVSLAVSEMVDAEGACTGYIGVASDITERKAAELALVESEERFRLAFDTSLMGMFMFEIGEHRSGHITRCNHAMAGFIGRSVTDRYLTELSVTPSAALEQLLELEAGAQVETEVQFQRADGTTMWGSISASVVAPEGSAPYGFCLVEDITARKAAEAQLQHMALHDPLTGLANRALFVDLVDRAMSDAENPDVGGVGVIFLDLDGFKEINDTGGHALGDQVLTIVAQRIVSAIRPNDTAARLGGDEFAVLCHGISGPAELHQVARRIRATIRQPIQLTAGTICDQLSASAGVAVAQSGCTTETLLKRADVPMYRAKRSGHDRVTLGAEFCSEARAAAAQLMPELARGVYQTEFVIHFQPIVNIATGQRVAAEALLRWKHPERGLLTPDQFLAVAETSRYMPAIGRYVLREACRQAAQWSGPWSRAAVHVNVSGRQLQCGDLHAEVVDALETTQLDPRRLVLELTETYAGLIADSTKRGLERLRRDGVRIAIDDVGTGFSGLVKIVDLPIDILKIDRQFIAGLPGDVRCIAITKAVLSLGRSLDLSIIAEGIESQTQRALLLEWGCEFGQGFLFGEMTSAE